MRISIKPYLFIKSYGMGLTLLIIASCDPFQEDLIQKNKQVTFSQTEFYILPGLSTIIHLKAIVKQSFVNASLKISEPPSHGKLSQLDTLVLHYRPHGNFTEGRDQFSLSVLSDGTILKTQLISIIIKQKVDEFPCAVYPIQDFIFPKINSSATVKFLNNDRICGIEKSSIHASIYSQPHQGQALLVADSIIYTPTPGYLGKDSMIYSLNSGTNLTFYGIVSIVVNKGLCHSTLKDFYVLDLTDNEVDPLIKTGDCGQGYELLSLGSLPSSCGSDFSFRFIRQTNHSGTVCRGLDGRFMYSPSQLPAVSDTAQFEVCMDGQCARPFIYIKRSGRWSVQPFFIGVGTIIFTDENVGYFATNSDYNGIYRTNDGGDHWDYLDNPLTARGVRNEISLEDFDFIDGNYGIFAYAEKNVFGRFSGGGIIITHDGGETWTRKTFDGGVTSVYLLSASTGFIGVTSYTDFLDESAQIYKTVDSGVSWNPVLDEYDASSVRDIHFVNNSTGYALLGPYIYKTTDSGQHWTQSPVFNGLFTSLTISNEKLFATGSVSGTGGIGPGTRNILRSEDGVHWYSLGEFSGVDHISFSPSGKLGFAVGGERSSAGTYWEPTIYKSTDMGSTWMKEIIPGGAADIRRRDQYSSIAVSVPSDKMAYVITGGHILKYSNE